jgi:hypothetical protein
MPDKTDEKQETFQKRRSVLEGAENPNQATESNTHLYAKEKLRDELPLRGRLKYSQCGKN